MIGPDNVTRIVVNVGGRPPTVYAEWMRLEMRRANAPPVCAVSSLCRRRPIIGSPRHLALMTIAEPVSVAGQGRASEVSAWSAWFERHPLPPSTCQIKKAANQPNRKETAIPLWFSRSAASVIMIGQQ